MLRSDLTCNHRYRPSTASQIRCIRLCLRAAVLLLALLLASCGGRGAGLQGVDQRDASFSFTLYPDTFVAGGSADSIALRELPASSAEGLRIRNFAVEARNARQLKALMFRLSYDPARYTPLSSDGRPGLGPEDSLLSLVLNSEPGVVEVARMRPRPQEDPAEGFAGSGELFRLRFAERPLSTQVRRSSAVPLSDDARSTLTFNPVGPLLSWRLFNPGDYSQDGQVLASDLTPIGIHFNEDVPAGNDPDGRDENSIQDVVDGNNDGTVAVADLTAIGLNFQNKILSFNLYRSTDPLDVPTSNDGPNGPGTVTVENIPMSAASGNAGTERLLFEFGLAGDPAGAIYWVRPNDGVTDGTPSSSALGGVAVNQAPIAVIEADVVEGTAPLTVNFDAGASVDDSDISTLNFAWDFETDQNADAFTDVPTVSHEYPFDGTFAATVTVSDEQGLFDTASIPILVNAPGNQLPTASLLLVNSNTTAPSPIVLDATDSTDPDGNIVEYRFDLDNDGIFDKVIADGSDPIISFNLSASGAHTFTLQVVDNQQGTDTTSQSTNVFNGFQLNEVIDLGQFIEPVDIACGGFNRTPTDASRFIVAYMEAGRNLRHVVSEDFNGVNWKGPADVTENLGCDHPNSSLHLGVVSGRPVIAFIDEVVGSTIRYVRANDQDGLSWPSTQFVASGQRLRSPFLRIVDGKPSIAFISDAVNDTSAASAFFSASNNSVGSGTWDAPVIVDDGFFRNKQLVPFPRLQLLFVSSDEEPAVVMNSNNLNRERSDNNRGTDWDGAPIISIFGPVFSSSIQLESGDEATGAVVMESQSIPEGERVRAVHATNAFGFAANQWPPFATIHESRDISPLVEFRRDGSFGVVCWHDNDLNALMYAKSENGEAEDYGPPEVVDFVDTAVFDMAVMSSTGRLLIVYFDKAQGVIKAANL